MKLDDMRYEKANLIDRAHNEFKWLRAQFVAEKAEIRRFHQLQLKQRSDEIEGRTILYYFRAAWFLLFFVATLPKNQTRASETSSKTLFYDRGMILNIFKQKKKNSQKMTFLFIAWAGTRITGRFLFLEKGFPSFPMHFVQGLWLWWYADRLFDLVHFVE